MGTDGGFCIDCGHWVESFEGLRACPACNSSSVRCADDRQVTVSVNWQELRVLCIWAESHQRTHSLGKTVYAIARRLVAQYPAHGSLTLAGDLGEIARQYETQVSDPALRRDIAEQTGEETGLIREAPDDP